MGAVSARALAPAPDLPNQGGSLGFVHAAMVSVLLLRVLTIADDVTPECREAIPDAAICRCGAGARVALAGRWSLLKLRQIDLCRIDFEVALCSAFAKLLCRSMASGFPPHGGAGWVCDRLPVRWSGGSAHFPVSVHMAMPWSCDDQATRNVVGFRRDGRVGYGEQGAA